MRGLRVPSLGLWALVAGATGCEVGPLEATTGDEVDRDRVVMRGVVLDRFEDDRLTARARMERLELHRDQGELRGEGVRIHVGGGADHREVWVRSQRGRTDLEGRQTELFGGVEARDEAGRTLETERLRHHEAEERWVAPGPVRLFGDNFEVEGTSAHGDAAGRSVRLDGPVRSVFRAADRGAP